MDREGVLDAIRGARADEDRSGAQGRRRAEKLRQVGRRIKNGSSMVTQMTPVKRAALVQRHYRRRRPMP